MSTRTQFEINGLIDTNKSVLDNLNTVANASGCFLTWDPKLGKWSVILNTTGSSVKSFDDSNILGSVNISGSGINELYNSVSVNFPNKDVRDTDDSVYLEISAIERYPQELDNTMRIDLPIINDPVLAQYIGARELKQSRLDTIVEFRSNFEANDLRAGDLIDITNDPLNYTNKLFRIITIEEEDDDDGNIIYSILAQVYDPDVYSDDDLTHELTSEFNGIKSKVLNQDIQQSEDVAFGNQMGRLLAANMLAGLLKNVLDPDTGENSIEANEESGLIPELLLRKVDITGPNTACEGETIALNVTIPSDICTAEDFDAPYTITGTNINENDVDIPLEGTVAISGGSGTLSIPISNPNETEGEETMVVKIGCTQHTVTIKDNYLSAAVYEVTPSAAEVDECQQLTFTISATNTANGESIPYTITGIDSSDLQSGDLSGSVTADWCDESATVVLDFVADPDQGDETIVFTLDGGLATASVTLTDGISLSASASPASITEGESTNATLTTVSVADGTTVPYTITGSASGKVSSPALTGTVTVNSNTASLNIQTSNNSTYEGTETLTVTFGPVAGFENCGTASAQVTVLDDEIEPEDDFDCEYVSVPLIWCGTFDGTTQYLKSVSVKEYITVPLAPSGGVAVPSAVTVSNPNTANASIDIVSTVNIDNVPSAGVKADIITAFDAPPGGGDTLITGTTITATGYFQ